MAKAAPPPTMTVMTKAMMAGIRLRLGTTTGWLYTVAVWVPGRATRGITAVAAMAHAGSAGRPGSITLGW